MIPPSGKRLFDLGLALAGLLFLAPLLAILALLVKAGDGGPAFFAQERIGRGARPFRLWKFRSMTGEPGPVLLTVGEDPRRTRLGAWMRAWKLDELPQLFNVVRGEMSLVGPRPEVARYVARYTEAQRRILDQRPGLTDPASLKYRDEARLLALVPDPEAHYLEVILPDKLRLGQEYADRATLVSDLGILLATLGLGRRKARVRSTS